MTFEPSRDIASWEKPNRQHNHAEHVSITIFSCTRGGARNPSPPREGGGEGGVSITMEVRQETCTFEPSRDIAVWENTELSA